MVESRMENRMQDRTLITTGVFGSALAAICCATPLLAIGLGAVGLSTWLASADYILIPIFILCLGLVVLGVYRKRVCGK